MNTSNPFVIDLDGYEFADLPKGEMVSIAINPFNGKVFVTLGNDAETSNLALQIMNRIVEACRVLEGKGSDDPLSDLMGKTCEQVGEILESNEEGTEEKRFSGSVIDWYELAG